MLIVAVHVDCNLCVVSVIIISHGVPPFCIVGNSYFPFLTAILGALAASRQVPASLPRRGVPVKKRYSVVKE